MEKTLLTGDIILVNKLVSGPRIPITPIFFPFSHQTLPFSSIASYWDGIQFPYLRIPGFGNVTRNDVLVFNYPLESYHPPDQRSYFLKRCVGLPGDTLQITKAQIEVNGKKLKDPKWVQFNYHITTFDDALNNEMLKELSITEGGRTAQKDSWQLTMTDSTLLKMKKLAYTDEVVWLLQPRGTAFTHVFPESEHYQWNRDNFGPVIVPKKGSQIELNLTNLALYGKVIETYEKNLLQVIDKEILINGTVVNSYSFKMDHYFVMGDNRHNSGDSRAWGFLPEDHLVGKAQTIVTSFENNKKETNSIRWNRVFKPIE